MTRWLAGAPQAALGAAGSLFRTAWMTGVAGAQGVISSALGVTRRLVAGVAAGTAVSAQLLAVRFAAALVSAAGTVGAALKGIRWSAAALSAALGTGASPVLRRFLVGASGAMAAVLAEAQRWRPLGAGVLAAGVLTGAVRVAQLLQAALVSVLSGAADILRSSPAAGLLRKGRRPPGQSGPRGFFRRPGGMR
ncbi:MAG: hypothetical protein KatS3mg051_1812 [Anaerolineae bacterium]|nr:MAG: hypothetical protein KatS3mg051_1812 [Anaerolineae bacterium]